MKRTALKRKKRVNPVSAKRRERSGKPGKLGIIRLYGADLEALRRERFEKDEYRCQHQLPNGNRCLKLVRWEPGFPDSGHLAHVQNKRMYGDTMENTLTKCEHCHMVFEHNPKSVPRKAV